MFNVNDIVTWNSQAQGYAKQKVGTVVDVVPAGERPSRDRFPDLYRSGVGFARNHVSYVVRVKNHHYWPRAAHLRPAG